MTSSPPKSSRFIRRIEIVWQQPLVRTTLKYSSLVVRPSVLWNSYSSLVFRPSANHGPVHLGRSAVNKLQLQGIQRVACRGEEDNAARRLVQAMHRLQPCFPRPRFVDEVAQIERLVKIDVRPVNQKPVGFHHGAHVFILVQDVEFRFYT